MVRHFVKPGITGLAQVKGFRGEIETNEDIINRVKFDIYYLENWSLILDLNIVFLTAINFLTGHKKAYSILVHNEYNDIRLRGKRACFCV